MQDVRCWIRPFLLLMLLVAMAGCGGSDTTPQPTDGGSPPKADGGFTIGMSQCNLAEPWRVQMNADVAAAAEKHPNLKVQ